MKQIELNTPFNLSLYMEDTISKSYNNSHGNSIENDLKLLDSKIKNKCGLIKQNSINPEQSNDRLKSNKSKFYIF